MQPTELVIDTELLGQALEELGEIEKWCDSMADGGSVFPATLSWLFIELKRAYKATKERNDKIEQGEI